MVTGQDALNAEILYKAKAGSLCLRRGMESYSQDGKWLFRWPELSRLIPLQSKGIQDVATRVSGLELGGLAGSLSAGAISDYLTSKNKKEGGTAGNVGLRVKVQLSALQTRQYSYFCNTSHANRASTMSCLPVYLP